MLDDFTDRFAALPTTQGIEKGGRVARYVQDGLHRLGAQYEPYVYATQAHGGVVASRKLLARRLLRCLPLTTPHRWLRRGCHAAVAKKEGALGESSYPPRAWYLKRRG